MTKNIKFLIFILLKLLLILLSCSTSEKYYISKNIQHRGGVDAINNIYTKKLAGKFIIREFGEVPFTIFLKKPDFIRIESNHDSKNLISACDGQKCWWINPLKNINQPTEMPQLEASRLMDLQFLYWEYLQRAQERMYNIKFLGKELVEQHEFYVLKLIKNGYEQNLYLDTEFFLERIIVGKLKGFNLKTETVFSEYKKVNDVLIPHKFELIVNGNLDVTTIVDKVELNVEIDDAIFFMPSK